MPSVNKWFSKDHSVYFTIVGNSTEVICDADVFHSLVKDSKWYFSKSTKYKDGRYEYLYNCKSGLAFHRHILNYKTGEGVVADHINRNRFDNRRSNLRLVTHRENNLNASSYTKVCKHRYKEIPITRVVKKGNVYYQSMFLGVYIGSSKSLMEAKNKIDQLWS